MHKIDEIYWNEDFIDDIEITLFEPECIITDNTKDEISSFSLCDNSKESTVQGKYLEAVEDYSFPTVNEVKDCVTIKPIINKSSVRQNNSNNEAVFYDNTSVADALVDATNAYLENIQMHSIFTPDKRFKPKEIFTQCHFCGKYVIIRMCPETGIYSKCKHCFNSPINFNHKNVHENVNALPLPLEPQISIKSDARFFKNFLSPDPVNQSKSDGAFKCDHCGKLFTRNWYLKQHIKLHLNEKPFACDHCEKRFLNSSNLKQHMRTHSVEYRCSICNKTYISQIALKDHISKHDSITTVTSKSSTIQTFPEDLRIQKLQCKFCKQKFFDENRLKEHLRSHTKELPYHCDKCDKFFELNNKLIKHKKVHGADSMFSF